jgi:hypothetical protein
MVEYVTRNKDIASELSTDGLLKMMELPGAVNFFDNLVEETVQDKSICFPTYTLHNAFLDILTRWISATKAHECRQ